MGWRDLLQADDECIVLPWVGGRTLRSETLTWKLDGKLPPEYGWYTFKLIRRRAVLGDATDAALTQSPIETPPGSLRYLVKGFLVGNRLVPDNIRVEADPNAIIALSEPVHLIEPGLDRFVRIIAGRTYEDGPLVYEGLDMPIGVEQDVLNAFLDENPTIADIKGVPPALDAAFRLESFQRAEAKRRREELERQRRAEDERRQQEERRRKLVEQLGDAAGRRQMAQVDFEQAARAALAVGGAVYLDHRQAPRHHEMVVRFRFLNRRFECTCDARTLRIIDAGICLTAHSDDGEFEEGTKGDGFFTLESLPSVIQEAENDDKLVVFRHVN